MKRTNIRVHRHGGKKGASPQVAKTTEPAQGKAQSQPYEGKVNIDTWDPKGAALVLMSGSEAGPEEEIAGLNYSAAEFEQIKAIAGDSATGLAAFLHSAIAARLQRGEVMSELENSINAAEALYDLMEHQVFHPAGEHIEDTKCGMVELRVMVFGRLRQAHEAAGKLAVLNK